MDRVNLSQKLEEVAKIGTWKVFLDREEVWWSPVTYSIHEEDPGKTITIDQGINYYVEEHRLIIEKCVTEGMQNNKAWDVELKIKTATGKEKWVRALGEPISENGKVVGLQGVFQDIDQKKRMTEKLQKAHSKIRLALKKSGIGFWEWDVKNNILTWDDAMYTMYGVKKEDFSSAYDAWLNGLLPEDRERGDKEVAQALNGEKDFDTHFRIQWPDGSIRHIKAYAEIIRDLDGTPSAMLGTNWDITTEKEQEKQMEHLNYQLQTVFDAIPGFVIHKNKDDVMVRVNKYAAASMNTTTEQMNGQPSSNFYDPELCKKYHQDDLEVIQSDQPKLGIVEEVHDDKGQRFWVKTDKVPYKDENGVNSGIVLCAFDISEQVETQKQLERLNEELTQFTYRTSHDLKAPLSTVLGLIQIMKTQLERSEYDEIKKNLDTSSRLVKRLENLIRDLLDLSRTDHVEEQSEEINIESEVKDIYENFLSVAPHLNLDLDLGESPLIHSSKVRVRQILENLISNGFKYRDPSKETQKIKVTLKANPSFFKFEVQDNGIGIPENYQNQVFKMFKRFHHEVEGSGLGLYLVKKHVDALNGDIDFESSGEGTIFKITLPKPS